MRLELVLIGVALALVGVLFAFTTEVQPTNCEASFLTGYRCTGGGVQRVMNPLGIGLVVTGMSLAILGAVLPAPAPTRAARAAAHQVPAPRAPAAPAPVYAPAQHAPVPRGPTVTGAPAASPAPGAPGSAGASAGARVGVAAAAGAATGAAARGPAGSAAVSSAEPESLVPGRRILDAKFEVVRGLGQGTFGGTFLAKDVLLDRLVVLKELLPQWRDDAEIRARFEREAKVVANLDHPFIVDLYGVEKWGDGLLLVMEYVDGGSLSGLLREKGRLPAADALAFTDQVLQALEAVHAKDVLHRDVKPSNVLLTGRGEVRLADFGVAHAPALGGTVAERAPGQSHPGSLPFMSPEQVAGVDLDVRSDLFAVAATLYYLVVGEPYVPLTGKSTQAMRRTILEDAPQLPVEGLSDELNAFLAIGLAKSPTDRFTDAADMRSALPER